MKLATLCYVRDNGSTLMMHRNKRADDMHLGKWNGLGGKIQDGETPEECAIREIKEESGLTVSGLTLKGVITFPAFSDHEDWYVFVFVIDRWSGSLQENHEGRLDWIADEQLLNLELWEGDKIFIPWLDQERFFSAKFIYQEYEYVDHQVVFY